MVKKIIILLYLVLLTNMLYSQCNDTLIIGNDIAEVMPKFRKSNETIDEFISNNIKYPLSAIKDSIEGKVFISLIIDTIGNTYCHIILRGIRKDLNQEALRVAKLIKFDKPAMQRGKPIKINYNIPIEFKLPEKEKKKW